MEVLFEPMTWITLVGLVLSLGVFVVKYIATFSGERASIDAKKTFDNLRNIVKE